MNIRLFSLVAPFVSLAAVACSMHDPQQGTSASGKTSQPLESPAPGSPAATLASGGTYWFVFDESPTVLQAVTSKCAGDAACVDAVRQEGAKEAIRISGSGPSALTWTSFGVGTGQEEVFLEIPIAITSTDGSLVHTRATGPAHGTQLGPGKIGPQELTFEVIDASTVAMVDGEKGKLLYRTRP